MSPCLQKFAEDRMREWDCIPWLVGVSPPDIRDLFVLYYWNYLTKGSDAHEYGELVIYSAENDFVTWRSC